MLSLPMMIAAAVIAFSPTTGAEVKRVDVAYDDLDLAVRDDALEMARRLERASRLVCIDESDHDIRRSRIAKACAADALARAVVELNAPLVTAIVEERN